MSIKGSTKYEFLIPEMVAFYNTCHSTRIVAKQYAITPTQSYYLLKRGGAKFHYHGRKYMDAFPLDEATKLYNDGSTVKAIALKFGYSPITVGFYLRKAGVDVKHVKNRAGGKIKTSDGYVHIYSPEHPVAGGWGYIMEHRLVMEKHLGRYLTRKEQVHHINGIRDDNRLENLELLTRSNHNLRTR
ncbi:MAG: HNH endonuclease signature motif containing protein, partial [Dehalococcoidales bacterium]|nr:HNH endonuclease signature motif containing protein [Dehalococcoidales bacterium]